MPTQIIRNGKLYLEYSPQELDKLRLEKEINHKIKHGVGRIATSHFLTHVSTNPTHKKGFSI